ncbi:hypothetical protein TNCV_2961231 [Trichonephila clavipes]|nr:hypothetical protein TNCV_2961231 [Trichonephila clavipes]
MIHAHVNIEGNECVHSLAKEATGHGQPCIIITLADANAVARSRLLPHSFKKSLLADFDSPRIIKSTIARLRSHHYKGIKIHPGGIRSYSVNTGRKSDRSRQNIYLSAQISSQEHQSLV